MLRRNTCTLFRVAVGTRIAPPPAQIRTCGFPASGSCLRSNVIGLRGIGYPCSSDPWARRFGDMLVPALCPGHASQLTLPSTGRLPSTVSAADVTRHCSRLHGYYAAVRLLTCVHAHRSAVAFMGRSDVPPDTDEVSQVPTKGRLHVHGVFDCARLLVRKPVPRGGCCFPANCTASAPRNSTRFAAQYPARGLPCERFKLALAGSPCITRGRRGWLGLTPWKTCTSYPLPACPGARSSGSKARVPGTSPPRGKSPQFTPMAARVAARVPRRGSMPSMP